MYKTRFTPEVQAILSDDDWLVSEESYDGNKNLVTESLFTLCSGKMSSRGAHEEGFVRKTLPAHYLHGVFDRSEAFQRELVNMPDWAKLKIYFLREPVSPETGKELSEYTRVLDLKNGLLAKHYIHEDEEGRRTRVETVKYLSRRHPRCGAMRYYVTPLNYAGIIEFENVIDATVTNFMDYPRFRVKHLAIREVYSLDGDGIGVLSETRDFLQAVASVAAVRLMDLTGEVFPTTRQYRPYGEVACEFFDAHLDEGQTVVVDKFAAVAAARDGFDVRKVALQELEGALIRGFEDGLQGNREIYDELWDKADLVIDGDAKMQKALRFNIFHLMSTPNPDDNLTNIGAKLLHGEEYGGHAFWDTELFILPFFSLVFPEQAKKLVEYRYQLLPGAKRNAIYRNGLGARYPWESADTGDEECPEWTIEGDGTAYPCTVADQELHVTADIIYGGLQYYHYTGDVRYYEENLLEMMAETARFWLSRLEWNEELQVYELTEVTGPDEWHEDVANNTYTNFLAKWNLETAVQHLRAFALAKTGDFKRLADKLALKDDELSEWSTVAAKIYLPAESGLLEEFSGYFELRDVPITEFNERGMPVFPHELRQYPRHENTIIKQADIVMLMFLFPDLFDEETQKINYDYYEKRTLHGSSLSPSIHCLMGLRTGDSHLAYEHLERSAYIDLEDKHKNTREGLHAAAAAGSWQSVVLGFGGLRIQADGILRIDPQLPSHWQKLGFKVNYQGVPLLVEITHVDVQVSSPIDTTMSYQVGEETFPVKWGIKR